jgi:hypothetical protein
MSSKKRNFSHACELSLPAAQPATTAGGRPGRPAAAGATATSGAMATAAVAPGPPSSLPFHLLDVFADSRHEGNQLLVVVDLEATLSSAQMLAITREINFAESAFVVGRRAEPAADGGDDQAAVRVRIFTPEYEVMPDQFVRALLRHSRQAMTLRCTHGGGRRFHSLGTRP